MPDNVTNGTELTLQEKGNAFADRLLDGLEGLRGSGELYPQQVSDLVQSLKEEIFGDDAENVSIHATHANGDLFTDALRVTAEGEQTVCECDGLRGYVGEANDNIMDKIIDAIERFSDEDGRYDENGLNVDEGWNNAIKYWVHNADYFLPESFNEESEGTVLALKVSGYAGEESVTADIYISSSYNNGQENTIEVRCPHVVIDSVDTELPDFTISDSWQPAPTDTPNTERVETIGYAHGDIPGEHIFCESSAGGSPTDTIYTVSIIGGREICSSEQHPITPSEAASFLHTARTEPDSLERMIAIESLMGAKEVALLDEIREAIGDRDPASLGLAFVRNEGYATECSLKGFDVATPEDVANVVCSYLLEEPIHAICLFAAYDENPEKFMTIWSGDGELDSLRIESFDVTDHDGNHYDVLAISSGWELLTCEAEDDDGHFFTLHADSDEWVTPFPETVDALHERINEEMNGTDSGEAVLETHEIDEDIPADILDIDINKLIDDASDAYTDNTVPDDGADVSDGTDVPGNVSDDDGGTEMENETHTDGTAFAADEDDTDGVDVG